VKFKVKLTSSC